MKSVRDVIRVAEVEIRRVQNGADHCEISFVLMLLVVVEMQQRRNVGNDVDPRQSPDDLVVDKSDRKAMSRDHKIISGSQIDSSENTANLSHVECIGNLIRFNCGVN